MDFLGGMETHPIHKILYIDTNSTQSFQTFLTNSTNKQTIHTHHDFCFYFNLSFAHLPSLAVVHTFRRPQTISGDESPVLKATCHLLRYFICWENEIVQYQHISGGEYGGVSVSNSRYSDGSYRSWDQVGVPEIGADLSSWCCAGEECVNGGVYKD